MRSSQSSTRMNLHTRSFRSTNNPSDRESLRMQALLDHSFEQLSTRASRRTCESAHTQDVHHRPANVRWGLHLLKMTTSQFIAKARQAQKMAMLRTVRALSQDKKIGGISAHSSREGLGGANCCLERCTVRSSMCGAPKSLSKAPANKGNW